MWPLLRLLASCVVAVPPALTATVEFGGTGSAALVLQNTGAGDTDFSLSAYGTGRQIAAAAAPLHAGGTVQSAAEAKPDAPDAAPASPPAAILNSGGPDPFGYQLKASHEASGPQYNWIEIAPPAGGSGTRLAELDGMDDGWFYPLQLPFTFHYYGTEYEQLAVASNGALYFDSVYIGFDNSPIPADNDYGIQRLLAPFWDDLDVYPGSIYYQDLGDRFVVVFYQVSGFGPSPDTITWQAILFADGNILFQYQDVTTGDERNNGADATVGIQGDSTTGLQYSYNTAALAADLAICFAYPGNSPDCVTCVPWLTYAPVSGTLAAGAQVEIALGFNAAVPEVDQPGDYRANLVINTSGKNALLVRQPTRRASEITLSVLRAIQNQRIRRLRLLRRGQHAGPVIDPLAQRLGPQRRIIERHTEPLQRLHLASQTRPQRIQRILRRRVIERSQI